MSHPLAANLAPGDFNATTVAYDAFEFMLLIAATVTFPVLGRTKNTLTEEAITFRLICPVVNRLRLFDFAM
jgi:hypothetical protein